jgi:glycogen debranching enzyme
MTRRTFLARSLAGCAGSFLTSCWSGSAFATIQGPTRTIASRFESSNPELIHLAEDIFAQCILGKIRAAEGMLKHRWLQAGTGKAFYGQWIWDTMFVVDLLAILPDQQELIREIFQNYWDFQDRWNQKRPEYAHDMIPCMIDPRNTEKWSEFPAYSQIPILGWGLERVYKRNRDKQLLQQSLGPLEKFHEWYWRERDVTNVGLVAVGAYSGIPQHARYETFDFECNLDELKLTTHPLRKGATEGNWYGDICLPGITSYLISSERSLQRLAKALGDSAMARRRERRIEKSIAAVRRYMWDGENGTFLAVNRDTLEKIRVATIGSWIPLMAEVPTRAMVKRMAQAFLTEHWQTPLPIPTVDHKDSRWVSNKYWRGDVWPAPNYQVAGGFALRGYRQIAADIADKTVANALRNGISEHYDSLTGKPLGVPYLGMSCTILTLMLDGLSRQYTLKLRSRPVKTGRLL